MIDTKVIQRLACANIGCWNHAEFEGANEKEVRDKAEARNWQYIKNRGKSDCLCPNCHRLNK